MAADDDEAIGRASESCRILCLTGPESSGKTTLAEALSARFGARLVPEVARSYLTGRSDYAAEDVLEIARQQVAAETLTLSETPGLVVCDTDLLVIQVWWQERFGDLPEELVNMLGAQSERAYLLMQPDLHWEEDPLRENPTDRDRLFLVYQTLLATGTMRHQVVAGTGEARLQAAVEAAQSLIPSLSAH